MKFLILGASGLVGYEVKRQLEEAGHEVRGTYCKDNGRFTGDPSFTRFEVGNLQRMDALLKEFAPGVIVSALRGDFDLQMRTHEQVMEYCKKDCTRKIIFISTLNVFDNDLSRIHVESEETNPESDYGIYKAKCEKLFLDNLEKRQVIILRIPSVWSRNCRRVQELQEASDKKKTIKVWTPLIHNYTTPEKIGDAIRYIVDKKLDGIFHVGSEESLDYTEFYRCVVQRLGISEGVLAVEELSPNRIYYQCLASEREEFAAMNAYGIEDILTEISDQIIGGADRPTAIEMDTF
ncbi:dTDP-4-dehydrorhamnose reductase [Lachnospiraceae bacterium XBB1006]|nr:dTDP-4-dehydrorhamnose reductase [Lachnospiraceae bacterium XBB1006]